MRDVIELSNEDLNSLENLIADNWGKNVCKRSADLESGLDKSYLKIIMPWTLKRVLELSSEKDHILDIGCGCGFLTNEIYNQGRHLVKGVDISLDSVSFARNKYPEISFTCCSIYNYVASNKYDLCLSIMSLHCVPSLLGFFTKMRSLLSTKGKGIIVMPHPCFWPKRHITSNEYYYKNEKTYEYMLSVGGKKNYSSNVLYFHRTLETYWNCINQSGFQVVYSEPLQELDLKQDPEMLAIIIVPSNN